MEFGIEYIWILTSTRKYKAYLPANTSLHFWILIVRVYTKTGDSNTILLQIL